MTARVYVLERVVGDIRIAVILFGVCRVGHNGIRLHEVADGWVALCAHCMNVPPCAIIVEAEADFLALAGVAEGGGRGTAGEACCAEGFVAGFADFASSGDSVRCTAELGKIALTTKLQYFKLVAEILSPTRVTGDFNIFTASVQSVSKYLAE
jgi:hypothetical protein